MENGEHFNVLLVHAIRHHERSIGDNELSGAGHPTRAPDVGTLAQHFDSMEDTCDHFARCNRIIAGDVVADRFKVARSSALSFLAANFFRTRATSSLLAKSPRSAAATPSSILPICQAFKAT